MLVIGQAPEVSEIPELTSGQHSYEDIRLRQQSMKIEEGRAFWDKVQAVATGGIAALALTGVVFAILQGRGLTEALKRR
jgi:hypothetical protein